MADIVDQATRSRMMAGIRARETKPEIIVRKALFAAGCRFRLHRKDLPGCPDIVLPGRRVVLFVHGCFWHAHIGCRYAKVPSTRQEFWVAKLATNSERDRRAHEALLSAGWRVLVVWECATRSGDTRHNLSGLLLEWLRGDSLSGEIDGLDRCS